MNINTLAAVAVATLATSLGAFVEGSNYNYPQPVISHVHELGATSSGQNRFELNTVAARLGSMAITSSSVDGVARSVTVTDQTIVVPLGGVLPNSFDNMVLWLRAPQAFTPHSAMPMLGVTERDARDMAAYLATLK